MRKIKLEEYKNMKTRSLILKGNFHHFSPLLQDEYIPHQTSNNKSVLYKTTESDLFFGKTLVSDLKLKDPKLEKDQFLTLRRSDGENIDFLRHSPSYIGGHIRARYVVREFSLIFHQLNKLMKEEEKTKIWNNNIEEQAINIWSRLQGLIWEFNSHSLHLKNDLSTIVNQDISKIMQIIYYSNLKGIFYLAMKNWTPDQN